MPELEVPDDPIKESDAIDFSDFNPFPEEEPGGETPAGETPAGETPGKGEGGEPPPAKQTETPPPGNEDPVLDIPNYGQIRASEVRTLLASQELFSNLQEEKETLQAERQRLDEQSSGLSEAIQVQGLLNFPAVRRAMQQAIGQLFASGDGVDPAQDGKANEFFDGLPPKLKDSIPHEQPKPQEDPRIEELERFKTTTEVNTLFAQLHSGDPEVVDQPFVDQVMDRALDMYRDAPDALGIRELRLIAENMIATKKAQSRSDDAEIAEAIRKLPPGTRVVPGGGHRSAVTKQEPKDPRKMEWSELQDELAEVLYEEEA